MGVVKVTLNGDTLIDITDTTVTAAEMFDDTVATGVDGEKMTGTYVAPTPRTASDVTVSGSTVTVPAGAYSSQVQKSVASGTEGTPTASKGAVSNHSVTVTPSVTNTAGYISGGTKTGTGVSVSASELVSGTLSVTENGTADVTNYASIDVDVEAEPNIESLTVTPTNSQQIFDGTVMVLDIPAGTYYNDYQENTKFNFGGLTISEFPFIEGNTYHVYGKVSYGSGAAAVEVIFSGDWTITWTQASGYKYTNKFPFTPTNSDNSYAPYWFGFEYNNYSGSTFLRATFPSGNKPGNITISQLSFKESALDGYLPVTIEAIPSTYIEPLSVTQNGTYTASGGVDGYSPVTVNVSGGGGTSVEPKDVNFIDYNGTILYSYTAQEAQALSELPSNPSHDGLTAQGWDWTLQQIKTQLTNVGGVVWVGQMYITSSGKTEIDVDIKPDALEPYLILAVNGTVSIDWGDNTALDTMTGTSLTTLKYQGHVYASAEKRTIKIAVLSGNFTFYNSGSSYPGVLRISNSANYSRKYSNDVLAIRIGSGVTKLGYYAFANCCSLTSVTIPSNVTSIDMYAFNYCSALTSVTIPSSVTSINSNTANYCSRLTSVAIPSSVTSIGSSAFSSCGALTSVTIPSGVTSIGNSAFYYCYALTSVTIPNDVTSIGNNAFFYCNSLTSVVIPSGVTSIGTNMFASCTALTSLTIPSGVTSIGMSAFTTAYSMEEYHFKPTIPPTLDNTNAFSGIQPYTKIYVPSASLSAYQTETNWSTYATYMVGE